MDPNFGTTQKAAVGETLVDYMCRHNLLFDCSVDNSIAPGHAAIRRALFYDREKPISSANYPKLLISTDCWNLDNGLTHYRWDNFRDESKPAKETVKDDFKDPLDVIRYTMIMEPTYLTRDSFKPIVNTGMANSGLGN
jgi:hypothetical protein